jgi:hypothetical protein
MKLDQSGWPKSLDLGAAPYADREIEFDNFTASKNRTPKVTSIEHVPAGPNTDPILQAIAHEEALQSGVLPVVDVVSGETIAASSQVQEPDATPSKWRKEMIRKMKIEGLGSAE